VRTKTTDSDPGHGDLGDPRSPPRIEALAGLAGLLLGLPRGAQARLDARDLRALEQILLEGLERGLQALGQRLIVVRARHLYCASAARWAFASQGSGI
jgi:hypothetical protein